MGQNERKRGARDTKERKNKKTESSLNEHGKWRASVLVLRVS